jgi:hypothetical protein
MNINEEWILIDVEMKSSIVSFPGATIAMDDGAYQQQTASRARRMVALWNAFLGVPLKEIQKLAKRRAECRKNGSRKSKKKTALPRKK